MPSIDFNLLKAPESGKNNMYFKIIILYTIKNKHIKKRTGLFYI